MCSEECKRATLRPARLGIVVLALLICASARAQADPPEAAAAPAPAVSTLSLSGVVVNSATGEPVRRAMVQAASTSGSGTTVSILTDSEGRFELAGLPESDINVLAHKPGFFSELELHPSEYQPQIVHLKADTPPLALKLLPEAVVLGHVATLKGEPIEDTPVRVLRELTANGYRRWEGRGQAITDEDGQFRIADLIPGRYLLVTGPNLPDIRHTRNHSVRQEGFASMFYPGVPDIDSATPFVITGGQQVQADFALKLEPIFRVAGTIIGLAPGSAAGIQVATRSGEIIPASIDVDPQTGKFQGAIPGGNYVLQLRGSDSAGRLFATDMPLVVSGDVEGIALALGSSITIPVNVDAHPSARTPEQAAAAVLPARDLAVSSVRFVSTELRMDSVEFQAERDEHNALALRNLVPGRYSVEVTPTAPWYVKSVSNGATDLLHEDLVIGAGRRPEPLDIVLRDDGASVRGQIRQDGQAGGGYVILFSDQASPLHAQTTQIAAGTEFYFTSLAPGEYKLLAVDSLDGLEFRNPDVITPYLSKATAVTLHSNEVGTANVEKVSVEK